MGCTSSIFVPSAKGLLLQSIHLQCIDELPWPVLWQAVYACWPCCACCGLLCTRLQALAGFQRSECSRSMNMWLLWRVMESITLSKDT